MGTLLGASTSCDCPSDPFCRQPPELAAKGRDVPVLNFLRQAEELECQDQVVSPQKHLHVGRIGPEAAGRNLGHGISALQLPQQKLLKSSVAVEAPDARRVPGAVDREPL